MLLREFEKFVSRFSSTLGAAVRNLAATGRTKKQCFSILVDMTLAVLSLWLAYSMRYGEPYTNIKPNLHLFLALPPITVLILLGFGVYKWVIRSSNERLTLSIVKGGIISSFALVVLMFLFPPLASAPRSVFAIYGLLFIASAVSLRQIWRSLFGVNNASGSGERVAVYGAGKAGQQLVELMKLDETRNPVLFVDDNPLIQKSTLAGLPVINGSLDEINYQIKTNSIGRIVLAMPAVKGQRYADIVNKLSELDVPVQTMPGIAEIMSGRAAPDQFRDISVDDLLGRSVVEPDVGLMRKCITGKVVLVTGGGGSIGSEICRQIVLLSPLRLIVLEQSEENLYQITEEMNAKLDHDERSKFLPVLGSVTNKEKLQWLFKTNKINTVYHAAAYKHVPIIEQYPEEAISVNIHGTLNVLEAAIDHNVKNFTLVSTDKAVRPANYMGATKRIAELILQAKAGLEHETVICMVRFGNVLGSSGSVVPKFKQQISEGGPVTITHREITRYFMTILEASQLVMQASALAEGGEVFVLDMGEPVKIFDLAESIIKLSGHSVAERVTGPGQIELKEVGLRPGEKMYEELFITDNAVRTSVEKIFVCEESHLPWSELDPLFNTESAKAERRLRIIALIDSIKGSSSDSSLERLQA